jgi:hypothetical protein
MVLDSEQQRQMLLSMLLAASIPGNAIEAVLELKESIKQAKIAGQNGLKEVPKVG